MIFGLLYFCVVILCVNRSRTSFILYRIVNVIADSPMFEEYGHAQTMTSHQGRTQTSFKGSYQQRTLYDCEFLLFIKLMVSKRQLN